MINNNIIDLTIDDDLEIVDLTTPTTNIPRQTAPQPPQPTIHVITDSPPLKPATPPNIQTSPHLTNQISLNCAICLSPFNSSDLSSTICGHIFCHSCITLALKTSKKCPSCRKDLKGKNAIHRLFI